MIIIGHRGARGLAPENTLAALKMGLTHHADQLEVDLRVTKDGVVVLHHDPYVVTDDGKKVTIALHSYAELVRLNPDLTKLSGVFEALPATAYLYLEVKPGEPLPPIIELLKGEADGRPIRRFSVGSFSQRILWELHTALPDVETIVIEKWSSVRAVRRARQLGTRRISMNQRWLWRGVIRSLTRLGYQLSPYTVNDPEKARRWAGFGLYGIVTDYPDRFERRP